MGSCLTIINDLPGQNVYVRIASSQYVWTVFTTIGVIILGTIIAVFGIFVGIASVALSATPVAPAAITAGSIGSIVIINLGLGLAGGAYTIGDAVGKAVSSMLQYDFINGFTTIIPDGQLKYCASLSWSVSISVRSYTVPPPINTCEMWYKDIVGFKDPAWTAPTADGNYNYYFQDIAKSTGSERRNYILKSNCVVSKLNRTDEYEFVDNLMNGEVSRYINTILESPVGFYRITNGWNNISLSEDHKYGRITKGMIQSLIEKGEWDNINSHKIMHQNSLSKLQ